MSIFNKYKDIVNQIEELQNVIKNMEKTIEVLTKTSNDININQVKQMPTSVSEIKNESENDYDLTDPDVYAKAISMAKNTKELEWINEKRKAQMRIKNSERMSKWRREHKNYWRKEEYENENTDDIPDEWYNTAVNAWRNAPNVIKKAVNEWMDKNLHFTVDDILGDQTNFNKILRAIRTPEEKAENENKDDKKSDIIEGAI
ncbi:MAG: hypothetical protein QXH07_06295 [Thermoplasmata archaeon]